MSREIMYGSIPNTPYWFCNSSSQNIKLKVGTLLKLCNTTHLWFVILIRGGQRAGTGGYGPNLAKMFETDWAIWRPNSDRICVRFGRVSGQAVNTVHGLGQNGLGFIKSGPKWDLLLSLGCNLLSSHFCRF
jgi:hypothetical protein